MSKITSLPFIYWGVLAIALRKIGDYSPPLIEYLWKHVSLIRKRRTKGGPFLFTYREVFTIALRRVGGYSLSFIEYLWKHVSMI